jgi:hypothetical protein
MMAVQDSEDYELVPRHELEELRREVAGLKKNSMSEGDKARILIESMDRLTISINRLITILDDAQKDIIEEYQQSKPAEKLNQIIEQNEVIARALLAMHTNLNDESARNPPIPQSQSILGKSNSQSSPQRNILGTVENNSYSVPPKNTEVTLEDNPYSMMPPSMPPMDDFAPLSDIPPLDNPLPTPPKKRFLGIM